MLLKSFKNKYFTAIIFSLISSVAIATIPLVETYDPLFKGWMTYMIGALFWLGVILEQVFLWMANADRKSIERRLRRMNTHTYSSSPVGVLTFFQCREAVVTDIALFVFAITVTLLSVFKCRESWIIILCISFLFLSFNLHCFLNGKNYKYIKSYSKYKKEQEKNG